MRGDRRDPVMPGKKIFSPLLSVEVPLAPIRSTIAFPADHNILGYMKVNNVDEYSLRRFSTFPYPDILVLPSFSEGYHTFFEYF